MLLCAAARAANCTRVTTATSVPALVASSISPSSSSATSTLLASTPLRLVRAQSTLTYVVSPVSSSLLPVSSSSASSASSSSSSSSPVLAPTLPTRGVSKAKAARELQIREMQRIKSDYYVRKLSDAEQLERKRVDKEREAWARRSALERRERVNTFLADKRRASAAGGAAVDEFYAALSWEQFHQTIWDFVRIGLRVRHSWLQLLLAKCAHGVQFTLTWRVVCKLLSSNVGTRTDAAAAAGVRSGWQPSVALSDQLLVAALAFQRLPMLVDALEDRAHYQLSPSRAMLEALYTHLVEPAASPAWLRQQLDAIRVRAEPGADDANDADAAIAALPQPGYAVRVHRAVQRAHLHEFTRADNDKNSSNDDNNIGGGEDSTSNATNVAAAERAREACAAQLDDALARIPPLYSSTSRALHARLALIANDPLERRSCARYAALLDHCVDLLERDDANDSLQHNAAHIVRRTFTTMMRLRVPFAADDAVAAASARLERVQRALAPADDDEHEDDAAAPAGDVADDNDSNDDDDDDAGEKKS